MPSSGHENKLTHRLSQTYGSAFVAGSEVLVFQEKNQHIAKLKKIGGVLKQQYDQGASKHTEKNHLCGLFFFFLRCVLLGTEPLGSTARGEINAL